MCTIDRDYWEGLTKRPGKYEGEPAYTPYYWECVVLAGAATETLTFLGGLTTDLCTVEEDEAAAFAEDGLAVGDELMLAETNSGFVISTKMS